MAQVTSIGGGAAGAAPPPGGARVRITRQGIPGDVRGSLGALPPPAPPALPAPRPAASRRLLPPPLTASRPAVASASGCPAGGAEAGRGGEE